MATRYLDHDHKDMKAAIVEACAGVTTDREKAIGIFNFVAIAIDLAGMDGSTTCGQARCGVELFQVFFWQSR
jgi:predicted GTPase